MIENGHDAFTWMWTIFPINFTVMVASLEHILKLAGQHSNGVYLPFCKFQLQPHLLSYETVISQLNYDGIVCGIFI
jgi:hypothetical protein